MDHEDAAQTLLADGTHYWCDYRNLYSYLRRPRARYSDAHKTLGDSAQVHIAPQASSTCLLSNYYDFRVQ